MNMDQDILQQMTDITKTFPGVKALDHVSLTLKRGTVHALMGENGAGKSTLMKCLFGIYNKDSGTILLEGKEVNFKNSREALDNGVAMVHQELNQALKRSVMDNIWLGRYPKHLGLVVDETKMYRETMKIFDELGINVDPHRIMSTMPVSQRQMVEIAKAVSYRSKVKYLTSRPPLLRRTRSSICSELSTCSATGAWASFIFRIKWRRSSASPTRSPSCATVSGLRPARLPSWRSTTSSA